MKSISQYKNYKLVTPKLSDEEDETLVPNGMSQLYLPHYVSTSQSTCVKVYLDEPIKEIKYYRNILNAIDSLGQDDAVLIKVDSPGGYLGSAMQLINAIQQTEAHVHVQIDGMAASAASLIALAAPSVSVAPYSSMMVHSASFGSAGHQSNVVTHSAFVDNQVKQIMKDIYSDFLTDKEFAEVMLGAELWFSSDEIIERLEKRAELQEKRHKKMMSEIKKQQKEAVKSYKPKNKIQEPSLECDVE